MTILNKMIYLSPPHMGEQPLQKVREELMRFFERFRLNIDINDIFPFAEITKAGGVL